MIKIKGYIELEKPAHCLGCNLRDDATDGCVMQRDGFGAFIIANSWEEQMENCPIKPIKDRCSKAEKTPTGKCRGYQYSRWNDEPVEDCQQCKDFELYEQE